MVRVESREKPCFLRTSGPFKDNVAHPDRSGYFAFFNANKYSISVRIDHPKGREIIRKLVCWADVVAESFRPGVLAKLGLDYESVRKIKPDIVMMSCSGQGQKGPAAAVPIAGNWLVALSGFPAFSGWPGAGPSQPFGAYTDFIGPRFGAVAVIAALRYKQRTGKGQHIDLSQLEAGIQFLAPGLLDHSVNRNEPEKRGNGDPAAAPHGVYPCAEGRWCAIAVFTDEEWRGFCRVAGRADLATDARFVTLAARKEHEAELNGIVAAWTGGLAPEEVMRTLQAAGVAAGVVESARDLCEDPQLRERGQFWRMEHRVIGPYDHLGQAATLSKTPARAERPAPCLGEHTQYVCEELLHMADDEFIQLLEEGVFEI